MKVYYDNYNDCCPSHMRDWTIIKGAIPNFEEVSSMYAADIVIVYLCAMSQMHFDYYDVILGKISALKKAKPHVKTFVGGCAFGLEDFDLTLEPYLDSIDYSFVKSDMAKVVLEALKLKDNTKSAAPYIEDNTASIQISSGCRRKCSFCKNNYLKNDLVSIPREQIFADIEEAVLNQKILHISLCGENTTEYGIDLYGKAQLQWLIRDTLKFFPAIKILDIYGMTLDEMDDSLIEYIMREPRIQRIQVEVQSFIQDVREKMKLTTTALHAKQVYETLRQKKDVVSQVIVGHPGETDENFNEMMEYILNTNAFSLGVVPLVVTEGTPCANMVCPPSDVVLRRRKRLEKRSETMRTSWAKNIIDSKQPLEGYVYKVDVERNTSYCRVLGQSANMLVPGIFELYSTVKAVPTKMNLDWSSVTVRFEARIV